MPCSFKQWINSSPHPHRSSSLKQIQLMVRTRLEPRASRLQVRRSLAWPQCLVLIQNESKIHTKHTNWINNTYKLSNTPMTGYSYELWSLPFLLCFSLTNSSCFLLKSSIMDCRVEKLQVNSFSIIVKHLLDLISLTLLKRKHMSLEAVSSLTNVLQLWPLHTV